MDKVLSHYQLGNVIAARHYAAALTITCLVNGFMDAGMTHRDATQTAEWLKS